MDPALSFIAGILAAFSPCVIVLIPLVLYEFFDKEEKKYALFGIFVVGFLVSYVLFGFLLTNLLTSEIKNGLKLGLGLLFVVLGALAFRDKINPLNMPLFKNPLFAGAVFAVLISFTACTIPYLNVLIALNGSAEIFLNLIAFGFGLIVPAILFAFVGQSVLHIANKGGRIMKQINRVMSLLLVLSGAYLAISITSFGTHDLYVVAAILVLAFVALIRSFFIINRRDEIKKPANIIYLLSLILIITAALIHCSGVVAGSVAPEQNVCSMEAVGNCEVCTSCMWTFTVALGLGFVASIVASRIK